MNSQLDQRQQPASAVEWRIAEVEEDWPGVYDCGAIYRRAASERPKPAIGDDDWWPGQCIL